MKKYINKAFFVFVMLFFSSVHSYGQEFPFSLSCAGSGTSGSNQLKVNFENFLIGFGAVDGVPIVFSNQLSGGDVSYNLIGWPRVQDTGNTRDIKHKIEISINRYNGNYSMTISRVGGADGVTGRASGQCVKNQSSQKF